MADDIRNWPTREELVDKVTEALCEMAGVEVREGDDFDIWHDNAEVVIDALIDAAMVFPVERFDEDCHACEALVRDHLVDGRHPVTAARMEREEWQALVDADTMNGIPVEAHIASVRHLAQRLLDLTVEGVAL